MQHFSHDPFRDETAELEAEWFSKEKPTWKPPPRQSSRPPAKEIGEELDDWFV